MNQQQFNEFIATEFDNILGILVNKGHDYGSDQAFKNFEDVSKGVGRTKEEVCQTLINLKVSRLNNLLNNNKEPKNEAVTDTLNDLIGYSLILKAMRVKATDAMELI